MSLLNIFIESRCVLGKGTNAIPQLRAKQSTCCGGPAWQKACKQSGCCVWVIWQTQRIQHLLQTKKMRSS